MQITCYEFNCNTKVDYAWRISENVLSLWAGKIVHVKSIDMPNRVLYVQFDKKNKANWIKQLCIIFLFPFCICIAFWYRMGYCMMQHKCTADAATQTESQWSPENRTTSLEMPPKIIPMDEGVSTMNDIMDQLNVQKSTRIYDPFTVSTQTRLTFGIASVSDGYLDISPDYESSEI